MEKTYESGSNKVNDLKFKLPSVTLANYGTAVPGKYGQIKKLQIVFTGRYEAYEYITSKTTFNNDQPRSGKEKDLCSDP